MQGLACSIAALLPSSADGAGWQAVYPAVRRAARRIAVVSVHGCPLLTAGGREIGGMNIYLRELGRELGNRGVTVDIYTRRHDDHESSITNLAPGVRVIHLDAGPRGPVPKEDLYPLLPEFLDNLESFRQARGLEYDLIHSHYWLSGWVGDLLHRSWQVPHVTMFHTMGEVKNRARAEEHESALRVRTERQIVTQADRIVVPSPQEGQQVIQVYGASADRVEVIPCGVDLTQFKPLDQAASRHLLGLPNGPTLLFVGRLEPLKGLDLLLEALALLPEETQLVVVGGDAQSDPEQQRVQALAARLGVTDRIRFVGSVPHDRLPLYYSAAEVCVVPSFYESFGMVALEAMACGTPVVAARVGGLQSTVIHGETGYLIPWRDPQEYAARIRGLLNDAPLRARLAAASRRAAREFSWAAVADQVLALFDEVLVDSASPVATAR